MKTTIISAKPCQPAGRYAQGSSFSKGDFIQDDNRGKFLVRLATGAIIVVSRLVILALCGKKPNQHVTGNDLNNLNGKEIDPSLFND